MFALIGILCGLYVVFDFVIFNSNHNTGWIALLGAISFYISIKESIKKTSISLKKIEFTEDKIAFTYANLKLPLTVFKENEIVTEIEMKKIVFTDKSSNTLIGDALKSNMVEQNQWEELVEHFTGRSL